MKRLLCVILFVILAPVHAADPDFSEPLTNEIDAIIKEAETIKPGQTRKDLLKVFSSPDGGLFSREDQAFGYRKCPYIKVNVHFKDVGKDTGKQPTLFVGNPDDIIVTISKPYLEYSTMD